MHFSDILLLIINGEKLKEVKFSLALAMEIWSGSQAAQAQKEDSQLSHIFALQLKRKLQLHVPQNSYKDKVS